MQIKQDTNHRRRLSRTLSLLLAALCLAFLVLSVTQPAYAGNDGLNGANIKDGQLIGYFGDGGNIVIPNTVTLIGPEAFKGNDNVTSVTIPGSVQTISYNAFDGCTALERVTFEGSSAELVFRLEAFANCPKLREIEIPERASYVTGNIFKGCSSLTDIQVNPKNPYYKVKDGVMFGPMVVDGDPQYDLDYWVLTSYPSGRSGSYSIPAEVEGKPVTRIWAGAFEKAAGLTDIKIPASITDIGSSAFAGTGLKELVIPDTVSELSIMVVRGCKDLTQVTLPRGLAMLGMYFFEGCTSLQHVDFPENLNGIEMNAFDGCTSLTSLVLPSEIRSLSYDVFQDCANLQRVVLPGKLMLIGGEGGYDIFKGCSPQLKLYVEKNSVADRWASKNNYHAEIVADCSAPENIDADTFYLIDNSRKVKVEGAFKLNQFLSVTRPVSGAGYRAVKEAAGDGASVYYEIGLLPGSGSAPETMTLKLGLPDNMKNSSKLYRVEGGALSQLEAATVNKILSAEISSLGGFAIIDKESQGGGDDSKVTSVTLNKTKAELTVGKTLKLSATVKPDTAADKNVTWSSSDSSVASVDSSGLVTGIKGGETVITAVSNGSEDISASCTVTVTEEAVAPQPGKNEISASFALYSGSALMPDGKAPFSLVIKQASGIATVTIHFETAVSSASDLSVEGAGGFTTVGDVQGNLEDGMFKGKAMLSYLTSDKSLFSGDSEVPMAVISVKGGKGTVLKLTVAEISGWDANHTVAYGKVKAIDPVRAEFTGEKSYDLNGDGVVDQLDITYAQLYYRAVSTDSDWAAASRCDFNGDLVVDLEDYIDILLHFTK